MARPRGRGSKGDPQLRALLAQHCARLVAEQGAADYGRALRKTAERFGIRDEAQLPDAREIEQALRQHQSLFAGGAQPAALQQRREAAVEAMRFLQPFHPRLVGPVLQGTADRHSAVQLHLFADDPDAVLRFLIEQRIPHRTGARRLRFGPARREQVPTVSFCADDIEFELTVLPNDALRQPPFEPGEDRPIERAGVNQVAALLRGAG